MSKMKMPEMSVVRFNESDVIVASGSPFLPDSVVFTNFSDGQKNNGTITYGGTTYAFAPTTEQGNIRNTFLNYAPYADYGVQAGGGWVRFDTLLSTEATQGTSDGVQNGTYYWDADQNKYHQ